MGDTLAQTVSNVNIKNTNKINGEKSLNAKLYEAASTQKASAASLKFIQSHDFGRFRFSAQMQALAEQSENIYAAPESIAERLNLPLLEVYGRLIRTLVETAGEDESQMAKVRDLVKRHLGEYAKVLEGITDANYQYLDLVDVSELNEDTAYALAILSIVRPRGDEIQLYVSGDAAAAQEQIHIVTNSYKNILIKLGAPGRANLKIINVSGWENGAIQKDMLAFATGKNGKLQAAILSARADFLEAVQVMKNIHRMNSAQVSGARALLFSPALLAQEIDEHTLDVLQMKDELERLGLGALLSEHFAQMISEIKLLAASA